MGVLIQLDIVFTWLTFPQKLHPYALRNHTNTLREIRILHTGGCWLKFVEVSTRDVGYCYIPGVISLSLSTTCYSVEKSHFIQTQWISTCVEFDESLSMNRTMYMMYLLCTIGDVEWLIGIDGAPGFMTYSRGEWNLGNTIDLWESWALMPKDFFSTSGWLGSSLLSFWTWSGLQFITGVQGFVKLSLRERDWQLQSGEKLCCDLHNVGLCTLFLWSVGYGDSHVKG